MDTSTMYGVAAVIVLLLAHVAAGILLALIPTPSHPVRAVPSAGPRSPAIRVTEAEQPVTDEVFA